MDVQQARKRMAVSRTVEAEASELTTTESAATAVSAPAVAASTGVGASPTGAGTTGAATVSTPPPAPIAAIGFAPFSFGVTAPPLLWAAAIGCSAAGAVSS